MNFDTIEYLQEGTQRQREAYQVLTEHQVLPKLALFTPILVGTIPINIDIDTSDLDIICDVTDQQSFISTILGSFGNEREFSMRESSAADQKVIVANFRLGNFEIELFGQNSPTHQQMAYRHMMIEHRLLTERGEVFRQAVIDLKRKGIKTEPAFGKLLGLEGNPYIELLAFEKP